MMQRFVYLVRKAVKHEFGFTMAMPAVIWQVGFLILPAIVLLFRSILSPDGWLPTPSNYISCCTYSYLISVWNSLLLAYLTAVACLFFCLPLALIINFYVKKELRAIVLFFLMMPSWTNFIIRIYSWFFLLRNDGMLFGMLQELGVLRANSSLLANYAVTLVVMVYCYFPYMLVPIYSYVSGIDAKILEASDDLGASSWQTFWRVVLPLSLKGIMTGCLVVVLAAFGEFAIPEFIGGGKHAYWGTLVGNNFLLLSDYNAGSAVIFFGIFSLLLSLVIVYYTLQVLLSLISGFVTVPQKILLFKFYD